MKIDPAVTPLIDPAVTPLIDPAVTPLYVEISYDEPIHVLSVFSNDDPVLLESTLRTDQERYSFLAFSPFQLLSCQEKKIGFKQNASSNAGETPRPLEELSLLDNQFLLDDDSLSDDNVILDDIFILLKKCLSQYPLITVPDLPPFQGGMAGFLGYELGRAIENIACAKTNDLKFPDVILGLYDLVIAWDHQLKKSYVFSSGYPEKETRLREKRAKERLNWACEKLQIVNQVCPGDKENNIIGEVTSNFTSGEYEEIVREVQEAIRAGDLFQVNIAQRFQVSCPENYDFLALYARLSKTNPAPFAGYCAFEDYKIISASPERFVSLKGNKVNTCPIKGTIARKIKSEINEVNHKTDSQNSRETIVNKSQDILQAQKLLNSAKDRAENIMIVDLLRNDLSRVCLPHHVTVTRLCQLETFATVHHLVSEIEGSLAPDYNAIDLIKAIFPGGSITGAPKIQAMQMIAALEPVVRGPYCGSMGYIGFNGDMDLSILIRSFVANKNKLTFHAGGAITLDSDPLLEYQETVLKAKALKSALLKTHES